MSLLGTIEGFQTTHKVTQAQIEALGYTRMEDGRYRSPDGESMIGADEAAQLVENRPDADPLINGVQYRNIEGFANVGPNFRGDERMSPAQEEESIRSEIEHLRRFGIEPINHPTYGWIAPDNEAFAKAHPIQQESGFDKALGAIMKTAIAGGMTAGIGTGLAGAAGLTGLPATAARAGTSALLSSVTGGNPLTSAGMSLVGSGIGDLASGDLADPTSGIGDTSNLPVGGGNLPAAAGTGMLAAVTRLANGTATAGDYAALGLTGAAAIGGLATMSGDRTTTSTQQTVVPQRTPEEIRLLQLQIEAFERDARLNNQITPVIQRQLDALNAELDRQAAHTTTGIREALRDAHVNILLGPDNVASDSEKAAFRSWVASKGYTLEELADAQGDTVEHVAEVYGMPLSEASRLRRSQQELTDIALRNARQGTNATPEQITQIDAATRAAQTAGEIDIARFRDETLRRINEEVSAASGLMPTDTPITALGDRAAAEVIRQQGGLTANLQNANANARLNYPLAAQTVQNATTVNASNLNMASQQFQQQLEQTAANNRYRLFATPYSLPATNTGAGNLAMNLGQERFGLGATSRTSTTPLGLSDYGSFLGGLGGVIRGVSSLFG